MYDLTQLSAGRPLMGDIALVENSPYFDARWYLRSFPDAVDCGLTPAEHYLWVGAVMNRDPSPYFAGTYYLEQNPEVAAIRMNPLVHFLRHGLAEGRAAHPDDTLPPRPVNRPPHDVRGPSPWGDAQRQSKLRLAVEKGPLDERPSSDALALANRILEQKTPPPVSVILPLRGREFFTALDSVLAQHLQPMEILVVYGKGNDEILTQIRRNYTEAVTSGLLRILPILDAGTDGAYQTALDAVRGELMCYIDGNSRWRPEYLNLMVAWFTENDDLMTGYCGWATHPVTGTGVRITGAPYDRATLLREQTIELSGYMHGRAVTDQLSGPDDELGASAPWDAILRHTALYSPGYLPFVGLDISERTPEPNAAALAAQVGARHRTDRWRYDHEAPRIAYVLWDWPSLSQSFVVSELEWLVARGFDVEVFFKILPERQADIPFDIIQHQVETPEELSRLLIQRDRTLVHCHFAYPAMTLLAWPACQRASIPFTFFGHAVDIFLHNNIAVNRIAEIMNDPLCLRLFVHGDYHRNRLEAQGIPVEKLAYAFQCADLDLFRAIPDKPRPAEDQPVRGVFVGRFVEKKGIETLIQAAALLRDTPVQFDVYGFGPLWGIIHEQARELGLDNLHFHGPLDGRHDVRDIYERADFCITPSIVADTGDTEGFPTVVMEAMAARRPVVTTNVSSIQNYLIDGVHAYIATPRDPASLAGAVRRMLVAPNAQRTTMLRNAGDFLHRYIGQDATMQTYCDTWYGAFVDIVLVTYNTPDHDDREATFEIIRRLRTHTTTPFRLTIIDNGSDAPFRAELRQLARSMPNMRLHLLGENRYVGPGTNLALAGSDSVFAIYVCSKEGFVAHHGWERPLIDYMRRNPDVAMGGHLSYQPAHTLGAEVAAHPAFGAFRNPEFALEHPTRPFRHVQGGVFILRRDAVDADSGFSQAVPQGNTDVEFSYFLESRGQKLGHIPEVASLTVKTLPKLDAVLDDTISIAHPLTESDLPMLHRLRRDGTTRCNLCQGWNCIQDDDRCAQCHSSGMDRKLFRVLAHDWRAHRGGTALLVDCVAMLADTLGERMFDVTSTTWQDLPQADTFALICLGSEPSHEMATHLLSRLAPGGLMIWPEGTGAEPAALLTKVPDLTAGVRQHLSRTLRCDGRRLFWLARGA